MPQGALILHFEVLMMNADIEIESPWAAERKLVKALASLEQAGHLQVTAANGRGENAMAVMNAGLAFEHCSTYWVPLISTEVFLNVDGTAATAGNKAAFDVGNPSAGIIFPGKMLSMSPLIMAESLPNWTKIEFEEMLQTGFIPNLITVVLAKRLEQLAGENIAITGWFIDIIKDVKLSVKSTDKT
jgi:hypothetical protein